MIIQGVRYQLTIYSKNVSTNPPDSTVHKTDIPRVIKCGFSTFKSPPLFLPKPGFFVWECKGNRTLYSLQIPQPIIFELLPLSSRVSSLFSKGLQM